MNIDIILGEYVSPGEAEELGTLAERYGLRAIWSTNYTDSRDPFLNLAMLARSSSTIRMGPLAVSALELHPVKMANSLLTLNELSDGRAIIAVGGGGAVLQGMGQKRARLVKSARECVEMLKRAATGERVNYAGDMYKMRGYHAAWTAPTPPLIYVAASKPLMIRMATELADGMMSSDLTPAMIRETVQLVHEGLAAFGRPVENFSINNFWAWHIKENKQAAIDEARQELALRGMLRRRYTEPFLDEDECEFVESKMGAFMNAFMWKTPVIEGVPDRIIDTLIDNLSSTGDLGDLDREIERFKEFEAAGLTEIALRVHGEPAAAIRIIGEKVAPAFR